LARNGYVTFGSFNQPLKISRPVRKLWSEILGRLPNSRLVVLGVQEGRVQADLVADIAGARIERSRIKVLPYVSLQDYYKSFGAVDIALDTLPYSGGTTTCDALWMGVPVITVPGSRSSSRSAASILTTVGLTEWIAPTAEEYVRRAVEYAGGQEVLAGLRATLRDRLRASPLMDEAGFVRDLESAYRRMWHRWCKSGETGP
jgi:protein O-GlcNAc transferase